MRNASTTRLLVVLVIVAVSGLCTAVQAAKVDKAVIIVKNKASSNGEVVFKFTPDSGESKEIKVGIVQKMNPHEIAEDIKKELILGLGESFKVTRKDSVKIVIKPMNKTTTFDIVISFILNYGSTGIKRISHIGRYLIRNKGD